MKIQDSRPDPTFSCHVLRLNDDAGILIDCGLFQGDETPMQGQEIDIPVAGLSDRILRQFVSP